MKLNLETLTTKYRVTGYSDRRVTVNNETLGDSFVITPFKLVKEWPPQNVTSIRPEHFSVIFDLEPDVILLGTGSKQLFPSPQLLEPIVKRGIGIEIMNTAAVCRTFNLLIAEGRHVAAGVLIDKGR